MINKLQINFERQADSFAYRRRPGARTIFPIPMDPSPGAIAAAGFVGIVRFRWNLVAVVLGSAAIGLVVKLF